VCLKEGVKNFNFNCNGGLAEQGLVKRNFTPLVLNEHGIGAFLNHALKNTHVIIGAQ
jgi:hypothetical protein